MSIILSEFDILLNQLICSMTFIKWLLFPWWVKVTVLPLGTSSLVTKSLVHIYIQGTRNLTYPGKVALIYSELQDSRSLI